MIQVVYLKNSIQGLPASVNKNLASPAFQLSPKANGTIRYSTSNSKVATVSSTGKVTIKGIGVANITVTAGNDMYQKVSDSVSIKVVPAAPKLNYIRSGAKKSLSVKWDKMPGVSGFKLQYSTSKNFKSVKTSYVSGSRHSKTRSDLLAGKTYYVRICAYKKIGNAQYQSAWSSVKSYTVRKK